MNVDCATLLASPDQPVEEVLRDTAAATLRAVQRRIDSLPMTWQAFWKLADDPEQFGEYGRAGNNFGRRSNSNAVRPSACCSTRIRSMTHSRSSGSRRGECHHARDALAATTVGEWRSRRALTASSPAFGCSI